MSEIEFRTGMAGIDDARMDGFFVGWPEPPTVRQLLDVMAGSHRRVWALHDGRVVGYICAISDGALNAFIPWLEVHPDFQHRGIGRELVQRLLAQLDDMYAIDLACDEHLLPWYASLGFTRAHAAIRRNRPVIRAQQERSAIPEVIVRPLEEDDAEQVLEAFTTASDMDRQGDVHDLESARRYVQRLMDADHRAFVAEWHGQLAALVALQVDQANRSAWVFYWAHPERRGAGITSRLLATVAAWSFHALGLQRLELGFRANNPASAAVAAAGGFIVEGRERGKFLINGERVDVLTAGRLIDDPTPRTSCLPLRDDM